MSSNAAGVWPIVLEMQGADQVRSMVEGLQRDLDRYASAGDQFASSMSRAMQKAFGAGRDAALSFKPAAAGLITIQNRLEETVWAIGKAYESGGITSRAAMEAIATASGGAMREARAMGEALGAQEAAARRVADAHRALSNAFNISTGYLGGWVRAGMAATAEGNLIGLRMSQISREIASLFQPAIMSAIGALEKIFTAFRSLSGEQQKMIGGIALVGVGALYLATVVPRIVEGFKAFQAVFASLSTALRANPILAAVEVLGLLLLSTKEGREALMELGKAFAPLAKGLADAFGGIIQAVGDLASALGKILGPAIKEIAALLAQLTNGFMEVLRVAGAAAPATASGTEHEQRVQRVARGEITPEAARAEERTWLEGFGHQIDRLLTSIGFNADENPEHVRRFREEADRLNAHQALTPAGGSMESFGAVYARLTSATARLEVQAQNTRQQQLEVQREIAQNTRPRPGTGDLPIWRERIPGQ